MVQFKAMYLWTSLSGSGSRRYKNPVNISEAPMERAAAVLLDGCERGCRDIASAAAPRRNHDAVMEMAAAGGPAPAVRPCPACPLPICHMATPREDGGGGAEGWGGKELR